MGEELKFQLHACDSERYRVNTPWESKRFALSHRDVTYVHPIKHTYIGVAIHFPLGVVALCLAVTVFAPPRKL